MVAVGPRLPFAWQARHTERAAARVVAVGPRLPFAWQAQHTELPGGAAARVVAVGHGLLFVWLPGKAAVRVVAVGPRLLLAWQAQYTHTLSLSVYVFCWCCSYFGFGMRYPDVVGKVWSSVSLLLQLHFSNGIDVLIISNTHYCQSFCRLLKGS